MEIHSETLLLYIIYYDLKQLNMEVSFFAFSFLLWTEAYILVIMRRQFVDPHYTWHLKFFSLKDMMERYDLVQSSCHFPFSIRMNRNEGFDFYRLTCGVLV